MDFFKERVQNIVNEDCYGRQNLFATKVGVSPSSVGNYITGSSSPKAEVLQNILDAFPDISADWLVLGRGTKYRPNRNETFMDGKFSYRGGVLENMQARMQHMEDELLKIKKEVGLVDEIILEKVPEPTPKPDPAPVFKAPIKTEDDDDSIYIYHKGPNG